MIFNRFILAVLFVLASPALYAYHFEVWTSTSAVDNSSGSDVGRYLAFQLLKLSLEKNNISYDFGTNGLYKLFSAPYDGSAHCVINGKHLTKYGNVDEVVLWPRDASNYGDVVCDYSIMIVFSEVQASGSSSSLFWYVYADYGVVRVQNYFNSSFSGSLSDRSLSLVPNVSNSMPHLVTDVSINYMSNKNRVFNIYQTSNGFNTAGVFYYGSLNEYLHSLGAYLMKYSGSTFQAWSGSSTFSLRDPSRLLRQSDLPWQLQYYNASYNDPDHVKVTMGEADTDAGTEPDMSEYYTGHDYLVAADDWGQPAEIGGGSSGGGGEITGFSSGAEGQMTSAGAEALAQYFGSSSDVDIPVLDSTPYTGTAEDPVLDSSWLVDPISTTGDMLPAGAGTFRTLVERLKNPDASTLPRFTLNFEVNTGNIAGVIWRGVHYDVDLATLKGSYPIIFTTLRLLAVVCMFVSVLIYVIKDNLFLGGDSTKEQ